MPERPPAHLSRRLSLVGLFSAIVILAGAATAWAALRSTGSGYVTATSSRGSVVQTLTTSGTVEPVSQATVSFEDSGQVATVNVAAGQSVAAGQTLATLDTTDLESTLSADQSAVTTAEAQLSQDETTEADQSSTSSTTTTTAPTSSPSGTGGNGGSGNSAVAQAQAAVAAAQQRADADAATAASLLAQAQAACGSSSAGHSTPSAPPGGQPSSSCTSALQAALAAQQQVAKDQRAVSQAESKLAGLLGQSSSSHPGRSSSGTGGSSSSPASSSSSGNSGNTGSGFTGSGSKFSGSGGGGTVTPESIAADQERVDADQQEVEIAQQSLDYSTLTSPIAGTVVSVSLTEGQSVSANSSSDTIVVVGQRSYQVSASLTESQVTQVKVGDVALVTVDGMTQAISGHVSQIGPITSATSSSYPITIALPLQRTPLFSGSDADVAIVLDTAHGVVTVPTSAVHTLGSLQTVDVLRNGTPTTVRVTTGVVGPLATEITSGLKAGETVVLADPSEPLPSTNTGNSGPGGGFGGGGFGGGGFGGFGGGGGGFVRQIQIG